ncbi:MAG: SusC/RagA family TonB-linked outer membrane protein [Chitinophagaceae bacterium]|nr:SusC/RagA family TonB-linked outer membrane protein [Chitinophagaceae bacterium]
MKSLSFLLPLRSLILIAVLFLTRQSFGQTGPLTGKVVDSTGKGLEGVSIIVKGQKKATTTDASGAFSLAIPAARVTLVISAVGYASQQVIVSAEQHEISVILNRSTEAMQDVIIVGYTQQSRAKTTAAVSKLDMAEMKDVSSPNPVLALQGKLPGVSVPVSSGQPGASPVNIIIRGGTKLNVYGTGIGNSSGNAVGSSDATSPLVIVDGVFRPMADVNPFNIESLQVMKDAAATSIYGAQGANGVIVVKTKSGRYNKKMTLTMNHRTTWETNSRTLNYMNAEQYLRLARTTVFNTHDALNKDNLLNKGGFSAGTKVYTAKGQYGKDINLTALYDNIVAIEGQDYVDGLLKKGWKTMDDPINPGTKLLYADNHYQDLLWNTGVTNNENISVDGGSDKASYFVSANYINQAGTFVGTNYKRYDVLGNLSYRPTDNFKLDIMANYQNILPNYVAGFVNELIRGTRITPLIRIFKDNGDPTVGELWTVVNRFHTLKYDQTRVSTERFVNRVAGDWTIIPGLHFKPSVSYYAQNYTYMFMRKATPADEVQPSTQRQKNENINNTRQLMTDQILQYDFNLGINHHFTALTGFNYTRKTGNTVTIGTQRASNDYVFTIAEPSTTSISGTVFTNVTDLGTTLSEQRSASYFGQMNYDYDGKYLFSSSLRYDGFSNFAPENKYALFPSAAVGWNVAREKFWHVTSVSTLKLRASWGQAGLSDLDLTDTYGGYSATQYAQNSGILRGNLANPNLKWETTETTDLAAEIGLFKDRVNLVVDYYNKLTKDRLDSKPLPSEAPFSSITYNNGTLRNRGVEIGLEAQVIHAGAFSWKTNFSFAFNRTVITKLPANGHPRNRQNGQVVWDPGTKQNIEQGGYAEGERPFGIWAFKVLGVFSTDAEAAAWNAKIKDNLASPSGITVGKHAGDYIFADVNGDGVIDQKDQVFMGYRTPSILGGMQNTFSWRGISMRITMDYALGHMISNGALARSLGQGRAYNEGAPREALGPDIWQKEGDVGKKYARFSFADYDFGQRNYLRNASLGTNYTYSSDVSTMIQKGDFLAFREISIGYDIPKDLLRRAHIVGLNVFASVNNIGYITGYKGFNPETYTGVDGGGYPRPRQYSLGATLKF